jgi:hypothetical protein
LIVVLLVLIVASCGGGGGGASGGTGPGLNPSGNQQNQIPNGPPVISQLTPNYGNPGDTVVISGYNFGDFIGQSTVAFYNNVQATATSWSDTSVTVTVPTGATTGVVSMTVNGRTSQSVNSAFFTVGGAPPLGDPYILSLSPGFGHPSDQIVIYGGNFGSFSPTGSIVLFASASGTGTVPAALVATGAASYAWTDTSIRCYVPASAGTGPVTVVAGTRMSNSVNFTVLPPQNPSGSPSIDQLIPDHGPVGAPVKIVGSGFGNIQGTSIVHFNGILAPVTSWSPNEIDVTVPEGATPGPVEVIVQGISSGNNILFNVELQPVITAVVPDEIVIGRPVLIYGKNFGMTQGHISFNGTEPDYSQVQWGDSLITVNKAPIITIVTPPGLLTVTTSLNTTTQPFDFTLKNVLKGIFTVTDPTSGIPLTIGVATQQEFQFTVDVAGGTAPYSYSFRFGDGVTAPATGDLQPENVATHIYNQQGFFDPTCLVRDADGITGIFEGPQIQIVPVGQPIITAIRDITVNHTDAIQPQLNTTPPTTRDPASTLLLDQPVGYPVQTPPPNSDVIEIDGYNFGAGPDPSAKITFNATGLNGSSTDLLSTSASVVSWTDNVITFKMPWITKNLTGYVIVTVPDIQNPGSTVPSPKAPFWVAPRITAVVGAPSLTSVSFIAYDLHPFQTTPPDAPNLMFGDQWALWVRPPSGSWVMQPLSINNYTATGFVFDMTTLNPPPVPGQYSFVVWVGFWNPGEQLPDGSTVKPIQVVDSGLLSDPITVTVS